MNDIFTDKINFLNNLSAEINLIIKQEALEQSDFIAKLNRNQLSRGQKGDGSSMPSYVTGSKQPSAPGKITLFDHGPFHAGIEPIVSNDKLEMVSIDKKVLFLIAKYGDILDLTNESQIKLRNKMIPGIRIKLKNRLPK